MLQLYSSGSAIDYGDKRAFSTYLALSAKRQQRAGGLQTLWGWGKKQDCFMYELRTRSCSLSFRLCEKEERVGCNAARVSASSSY